MRLRHFYVPWGKYVIGICLLAAASVGIGLLVNELRPEPLSLHYASARRVIMEDNSAITAAGRADPVRLSFPSADHLQPIDWQTFRALAESRRAIILDARPEKIFRVGHVPGALSMSRAEFATDYARLRASIEEDKERPIAVYCTASDCEDSEWVGDALIQLGYRLVLIFKGGWAEWNFQRLPREANP